MSSRPVRYKTISHALVVTRHPPLVVYLREINLIDNTATVLKHAQFSDVRDRHVVGILPVHMLKVTASLTHIPLPVPPELRGHLLTLEQVRLYAQPPQRISVREEPVWLES